MTIVVDASVVIPSALAGGWSDVLTRGSLVAPTLLWSEVAAALRQMHWRGDILGRDVRFAFRWLRGAGIASHHSGDLIEDASALAARLGWAKTYDAEYVTLAQRLDAQLATLDARLARAVRDLIRVTAP